jgi:hypothetical protein
MRYMAPELHAESTPDWSGPKLGVQTDIYALAMTIWEVHLCSSPHVAIFDTFMWHSCFPVSPPLHIYGRTPTLW